jgi:lysophospholipase L1-like esterase
MAYVPWATGEGPLTIHSGDRVAIGGDSITATGVNGWAEELINQSQILYGDGINWFLYGASGTSLHDWTNVTTYTDAVLAFNPDVIITELGTNFTPSNKTRASFATDAEALIDYYRAQRPAVRQAMCSTWNHGSELTPDPYQAATDASNGGLTDACAARGIQYIDVRNRYLQGEALLNPAPGVARGILTADGLHPNWRGRPMYGVEARRNVIWASPTYAEPDWSTWQPDADVTPSLWLEARQLSQADGSPVSTWGAFTASGASRPTYVATGWLGGPPVVRFNGANVMTAAGLSTPAGAKTVFVVSNLASFTFGQPGNYVSLLSLKVSAGVYAQIMPLSSYNDYKTWSFTGDVHSDHSTGYPSLMLRDAYIYNSDNPDPFPTRISATWDGGDIQAAGSFAFQQGGGLSGQTLVQSLNGFMLPSATSVTSLGGRLDGSTLDHAFTGDVAAILVYPGVLTTVQRARVGEYLRRKYGP